MRRRPLGVLPSVEFDPETSVAVWLDAIPDRDELEAPEPKPYAASTYHAQRAMQVDNVNAEGKHVDIIFGDRSGNEPECKRLRGPLAQHPGPRLPVFRTLIDRPAPLWPDPRRLMYVHEDDDLAEHTYYRELSLAPNKMYIFTGYRPELPPHVVGVVTRIQDDAEVGTSINTGMAEPSLASVASDTPLHSMPHGTPLTEVVQYFAAKLFCAPTVESGLYRAMGAAMPRSTLPDLLLVSNVDITIPAGRYPMNAIAMPRPGVLYGYALDASFPQFQHRTLLQKMASTTTSTMESDDDGGAVWLPFFSVEFVSEASGGSLMAATNRCIVNSAACVHMVETLNARLPGGAAINSTAFSMAMSGTEARMYVTWADQGKPNNRGTAKAATGGGRPSYYMATIGMYIMQRPEDYVEVHRRFVRVLDWARGPRLDAIRSGLGALADGSEEIGSGQADQTDQKDQ